MEKRNTQGPSFPPPQSYVFDEVDVGLEASFTVDLSREMIDTFARFTGDRNPLHTDAAKAHKCGFKDQVAHGMLTSSFYSTLVGMYLPGVHALLNRIKLSFHHPVYPGDCLVVSGEVSHKNEAYSQIEISAHIKNQDDIKVSSAKISVGFTILD